MMWRVQRWLAWAECLIFGHNDVLGTCVRCGQVVKR